MTNLTIMSKQTSSQYTDDDGSRLRDDPGLGVYDGPGPDGDVPPQLALVAHHRAAQDLHVRPPRGVLRGHSETGVTVIINKAGVLLAVIIPSSYCHIETVHCCCLYALVDIIRLGLSESLAHVPVDDPVAV